MKVAARYPGIRVTANGNQLVAYHTETRIADAGVFYPITTREAQQSPFCLVQSDSAKEGLCADLGSATAPYRMEYTFEQHPGVVHGAVIPKADDFSGFPVHQEFRICHFLFADPNSTKTLAPIVMRGYQGDWHAGVDVYKEWRNTWFKTPHLPEWAKEVHSWTMLRMNTPEEDYTISYKKFVEYGEEYAQYGVKAVQLIGWNIGGQDRDDPSQDRHHGDGP